MVSYITFPVIKSTGSPPNLQNAFSNHLGIFLPNFSNSLREVFRIATDAAGIIKPIPKDINPCFES